MKFLMMALTFLSMSTFSAEKLGQDAVEMLRVLGNPQVKECLADVDISNLISVEITKETFRCPMCNNYVISGHQLWGDVASPDKTVITLKGSGEFFGFGFTQKFDCKVETISR